MKEYLKELDALIARVVKAPQQHAGDLVPFNRRMPL
jgi:hypothetical protein